MIEPELVVGGFADPSHGTEGAPPDPMIAP
jgi:hypothetical protein